MTACGDSEQSRSRELPRRTPPASQDGALSAAEACGIHAAAKESNHWVSRGAEGAERGGAGSSFLDMHFQKYREQKHWDFWVVETGLTDTKSKAEESRETEGFWCLKES